VGSQREQGGSVGAGKNGASGPGRPLGRFQGCGLGISAGIEGSRREPPWPALGGKEGREKKGCTPYSVLSIDKLKLTNHTFASHGLKAADAGGENR
jgi:hypothetical protein